MFTELRNQTQRNLRETAKKEATPEAIYRALEEVAKDLKKQYRKDFEEIAAPLVTYLEGLLEKSDSELLHRAP